MNAGNKITQGILMAEELNMHFSSVFTREDTSSLPVPETKFEGSEGERLGQLVVTPEVVANKINNMKENTLTFQIVVQIRLFIFRKIAVLYGLIRPYTFIIFGSNPPYTIFIWSMFITLKIFNIFEVILR